MTTDYSTNGQAIIEISHGHLSICLLPTSSPKSAVVAKNRAQRNMHQRRFAACRNAFFVVCVLPGVWHRRRKVMGLFPFFRPLCRVNSGLFSPTFERLVVFVPAVPVVWDKFSCNNNGCCFGFLYKTVKTTGNSAYGSVYRAYFHTNLQLYIRSLSQTFASSPPTRRAASGDPVLRATRASAYREPCVC